MSTDERPSVPDLLVDPLARVRVAIDDIRASARAAAGAASDPRGDATLSEAPPYGVGMIESAYHTIAVLGRRGSGKTTVLSMILRELARTDLLLPPIQPERFTDDDTFLGWLVSGLRCHVAWCDDRMRAQQAESLGPAIEAGEGLVAAYGRLQRQVGAVRGRFRDSLARGTADRFEFETEMARLSFDGLTLADELAQFLDRLLAAATSLRVGSAAGGGWFPLLVIPVDDADMVPNRVTEILQSLRFVVCHPRVVAIIAGDVDTLHFALRAAFQTTPGAVVAREASSDASLARFRDAHVESQLTKYLPRHLRVTLPKLDAVDRLLFTPLDQNLSILDLLNRYEVARPAHEPRRPNLVGDYFDFSWAFGETGEDKPKVVPSQYADALPDVPRDLVQLHGMLRIGLGSGGNGGVRTSGGFLRQLWLDHLVACLPLAEQDTVRSVLIWYRDAGEWVVDTDFRTFKDFHAVGRSRRLHWRTDATMQLRCFLRNGIGYATSDRPARKDNAPADEVTSDEAPSFQAQALVALATEMDEGGFDLERGTFGKLRRLGGISWIHYTVVEFEKSETDCQFWVIPDWDCVIDVLLYGTHWNRVVDLLRAFGEVGDDDDALHLEAAALAHVAGVLAVAATRSLPPLPFGMDEVRQAGSLSALWTRRREELAAPLAATARELFLRGSGPSGNRRDRDYARWFTGLFPWMADSLCSTRWLADWVLGTWEATLRAAREVGDRRDHAGSARQMLAERIRLSLGQPWVRETCGLLAAMGDPHRAGDLRRQAEQLAMRETATQDELTKLMRALLTAGVPQEILMDALKAGEVTPVLQAQLLEAGVPAAMIARLATLIGETTKRGAGLGRASGSRTGPVGAQGQPDPGPTS